MMMAMMEICMCIVFEPRGHSQASTPWTSNP